MRSNQLRRVFNNNCKLVYSEPSFRLGYPSLFLTVTLNGWKKFATLLPNNWLAETPLALALMRLGRQSAERERISEIKGNVFSQKVFIYFSSILILSKNIILSSLIIFFTSFSSCKLYVLIEFPLDSLYAPNKYVSPNFNSTLSSPMA
ncbi:hypothetical protein SAMN05878482_106182 [Peribacillus simplex]|uniref:Uncharacterized protein n=1 Tax=Peribacillus simplex TaxID=1478 RepID=A0A9X8RC39_9BACI|nr:hypothetical protein SAMN05878482_106182 [Peribacillus simplex]